MKNHTKYLSAIAISACLGVALNVSADGCVGKDGNPRKFYGRVSIGLPASRKFEHPLEPELSWRPTAHIALGKQFTNCLSAEIEGGLVYFPLKVTIPQEEGSIRSLNAFMNLRVHPRQIKYESLQPFFGGGVGFSNNRMTDIGSPAGIVGATTNKFAWQVFGGVEYMMKQSISILVDARYTNFGDFDVDSNGPIKVPLSSVSLTFGARYKF